MHDAWMQNETAAAVFGFRTGDAWEDTYSRVSVLGLIMWVCAYVQALVLRKLDDWKDEVNATADATRYGNEAWWKRMVMGFQLGDSVEVIDGKMGYRVEDETKQIVTGATIESIGRVLNIKVAKGDAGSRVALTEDELAALQSYVDEIKPLGLAVDCSSGAAGVLSVAGMVRYSGQRTLAAVRAEVAEAVRAACDEMEFGGTLYASAVLHAVMSVKGVVSASLTMQLDGSTVGEYVVPPSGYVVTDVNNIRYMAQ